MTVKDAVSVLKNARKIVLGYGANAIPFDKDDSLSIDAYGKYVVDEILCEGDGYYEVNIAMQFVKEGD